jgi:hypothetical protein
MRSFTALVDGVQLGGCQAPTGSWPLALGPIGRACAVIPYKADGPWVSAKKAASSLTHNGFKKSRRSAAAGSDMQWSAIVEGRRRAEGNIHDSGTIQSSSTTPQARATPPPSAICFFWRRKRAACKDRTVRAPQQVWRQICGIRRLFHACAVQRLEHRRLAQLDQGKGQSLRCRTHVRG